MLSDQTLFSNGFKIPGNLPADIKDWLKQLTKVTGPRDGDLLKIREQFEGGDKAICEKYFPCPDGMERKDWHQFRRLLVHVNLVRPMVRCWTAAVYSGERIVNVTAAPHKLDIIKEFVRSPCYNDAIFDWNENAVTYGTAIAAPCYSKETEELSVWLPDPIYTWIQTDPMDVTKVLAFAEVNPKLGRIIFMTVAGSGWITKDASFFEPMNFGWLPVAIAYGQSRIHRGEKYGLPLVSDAADWSVRITDTAFNASIIQKLETRSTLVITGDEEEVDASSGWGPGKDMKLRQDADAKYISPEAKLKETIDIMKQFMGLLATANSVPQDVFDATLTESVSSAEAARIRAIPLVQRAKQLVPTWRANEHKLITASCGMVEFIDGDQSKEIDYIRLKRAVKTDIQITPNIIPLSMNEEVQNAIALGTAGYKTRTDLIRQFNPMKDDAQIAAMVAEQKAMEDKAESAQAIGQSAFKKSADVKPKQQY
jgi:hypothetical protein